MRRSFDATLAGFIAGLIFLAFAFAAFDFGLQALAVAMALCAAACLAAAPVLFLLESGRLLARPIIDQPPRADRRGR